MPGLPGLPLGAGLALMQRRGSLGRTTALAGITVVVGWSLADRWTGRWLRRWFAGQNSQAALTDLAVVAMVFGITIGGLHGRRDGGLARVDAC